MKVVILNKSDATGGAAVVSRRLLEALRGEGVDAQMLVCEKLTDSPFVELAANPKDIKFKFLLERLKIYIATGCNRKNLFKIDTGEEGLPLWKNPLVKEADAILINWVNQGMLSLKGFEKILKLGKPVICTMHDMWNLTGICHHAGKCINYKKECGECPLLEKLASSNDLSHKIWIKKNLIYNNSQLNRQLAFVPVSNWLKNKALESSLLKSQRIEVIPNPFSLNINDPSISLSGDLTRTNSKTPTRILFGAARLDDPIKGLDTLRETSKILKEKYPDIAKNLELALFGNIKNPANLEGFALPLIRLGVLSDEKEVRSAYQKSQIVVSASSYETLPGTLVEAQAYGCIPVSFNQGGQSDIVENGVTGFIAEYSDDPETRAENLAIAITRAYEIAREETVYEKMKQEMRKSVEEKFSYKEIALKYVALIKKLS
ncbi:MAG: glycosyltransferase [Muribaculaceae bacterium]|nr:glycosyltransferase [Muribaculaceae bacterium]